tara:strand:- start:2793 stop:2984 length:192 start_codon:yes stop_codon:yes gene_type:complete
MLSFEEWFKVNEDELRIKFAENGADRELDFDFEAECYKEYKYISYVTDPANVRINNHSVQPMD